MSRIAASTDDAVLPTGASEILAFSESNGAPDPRMARVLVRSSAGVAFLSYWANSLYEGDLPHRLKEIVRIYLSASQGCAYCSVVRSAQGAAEGINDDLLLGLDDIAANAHLSDDEKVALEFARRFKAGDADEDSVFAALRERFSEEQILELGLFCGTVIGIGTFAKLLHVVTWDEVCALKPNMKRLRQLGDAQT